MTQSAAYWRGYEAGLRSERIPVSCWNDISDGYYSDYAIGFRDGFTSKGVQLDSHVGKAQ